MAIAMMLVMMSFAVLDHNVVRVLFVVIIEHKRIFRQNNVRTLFASSEHRSKFGSEVEQCGNKQ